MLAVLEHFITLYFSHFQTKLYDAGQNPNITKIVNFFPLVYAFLLQNVKLFSWFKFSLSQFTGKDFPGLPGESPAETSREICAEGTGRSRVS